MKDLKLDSLCVQAGYSPETGESRIPPICQSTTFFYGDTQKMADCFDLKSDGYFYSRLANPTVAALEGKVAALEDGVAAIGCASGMSATTLATFTVAGAGDNVVISQACYGGTFNLFGTTLPKLGIECRFFNPDAPAEEIEKLIDDKTKFVFCETIANPSIVV
ncbi:MAG: PLP-dependent transferase, partial [Candidatus Coproplasma sp.]